MRSATRLVIIATTIVVSAGLAQVASPVPAAAANDVDVLSAKAWREDFGLRADAAYVRSSLTDARAFSNTDWGLPLSNEEVDDLTARLKVQKALPPVIDHAIRQPGYAGGFIDQRDKGMPVFLFTKDVATRSNEIGDRLPPGTRYDVRKVEHTLAELTALKEKASNARTALYEDGVVLVSATVDVERNRVEVGVLDRNERKRDAVKAVDERLVVIDQELPRVDVCQIDNCPNLKGGLRIHQTSSSQEGCTSGYLALRYDTSPDQLVMITAGHCIALGTGGNWKHAGSGFGAEILNSGGNAVHGWTIGSLADVAPIRVWDGQVPPNRNTFLSKPSTGTSAQFNGTLSFAQQYKGLQVCRIGWGSDALAPSGNSHYTARKCGEITRFDTDSNGTSDDDSESCNPSGTTCKYIKNMKKVNFDSWGGDSGGVFFEKNSPVDATTKLLGSHVHSEKGEFGHPNPDLDADRSWYSTVEKAQDRLANVGIHVIACVTASCGYE